MANGLDRGEIRNSEHRTVSRAMGILEAVIANEPQGLRLGDLSEQVKAPKSSIHGLAKGLVAMGYLREHQARYYQGPALAMLAPGLLRLPANAHRVLERLAVEADETAILAALVGESVINVDFVESSQLIRASPVVNVRRPLLPTSYGKVFLAFMEPSKRDSYLARNFPEIERREAITLELEEIRSSRVAFNRAESTPGLYGLAAPILGEEGIILAIGVAGPADRMQGREAELARVVTAAAAELSLAQSA
ncbi:IclR family transcriptional regulator [Arthrobacter sp. M4]|uniref:IclR family transcriptional regulator n=1 Tax=Arthrobacter sp. M4 TaxID=218160 RepID=UPI001CDD05B9|nr:IclR family transcriptional regulator [Arthrobacter sp. M4]MCA4135373.1 IclR family transcriptional regulator [Arthrobacter sp. M4]